MSQQNIKNIIFDVGNVLVQWSPLNIVKKTFPHYKKHDIDTVINAVFKSDIWKQLNLGTITEKEAINKLALSTTLQENELEKLFCNIKITQDPVPGTFEVLTKLYDMKFNLLALTDNVNEIISYLKKRYEFWKYFSHIIVSAEIGMMKPDINIFKYVLSEHQLDPLQTLFIDDHLQNIQSAQLLSINCFQFSNCEDFKSELLKYNIYI